MWTLRSLRVSGGSFGLPLLGRLRWRGALIAATDQAVIFLYRDDDDNRSSVLFDRDRLGASLVDEEAEAVLRLPCRHALQDVSPLIRAIIAIRATIAIIAFRGETGASRPVVQGQVRERLLSVVAK